MLTPTEKHRYSRHLKLDGFGEAAQLRLKSARVLVVGAGGLGSPVLLYLTAAGVGKIGVVDGDLVSLSNLQRQVLFNEQNIGENKAEAAVKHLSVLNADINLQAYPHFLDVDNALELIASYDLVIDGSDNFATRYLINDACVISGKPLIYGAIFKFTGQVSVFNYQNGPTYRCLFPEPPADGEMPGCGEVGVVGVLPGIIGTWQASEAIKVIAGIGEALKGKLLCFDLLTNEVESVEFDLNPDNLRITELKAVEYNCSTDVKIISWDEFVALREQGSLRVIDVRETNEYLEKNLGGENYPLSTLDHYFPKILSGEKLVIHCRTGKRAHTAAVKFPEWEQKYILEEIPWEKL